MQARHSLALAIEARPTQSTLPGKSKCFDNKKNWLKIFCLTANVSRIPADLRNAVAPAATQPAVTVPRMPRRQSAVTVFWQRSYANSEVIFN